MDDVAVYSSDSIAPTVEFIPADYCAPLELATIFPRPAPLEIDLGCGNGTFLTGLATRYPERNFLGIERLIGRVRSACQKVVHAKLSNVRVFRIESSYAVQYLLPPESISVVHLLFPDPWPKKRHQRRRLVTAEFLAAIHRILAPGGLFRVATDQEDYFTAIRALASAAPFSEEAGDEPEIFPLTTFEKHFVAARVPVHRLRLRKIA